MTLRSRATVEILAALAVGAGLIALVLTSDHESQKALTAILAPLVGWAFIGSGIVARIRRPENPTGLLLMAVGFTWFLGALFESNEKYVFTFGSSVEAIFLAVFVHLLATYPTGHLETRAQRILVYGTYAVALLANVTVVTVQSDLGAPHCDNCPPNAALVVDSPRTSGILLAFWDVVGALLVAAIIVILVSRWRGATKAARRAIWPVVFSGGVALLLLGLAFATDSASHTANEIFGVLAQLAFFSVPFFFLAGLLRFRLARTGVGRLIQDTPDDATLHETQETLRRTLRDPSLRILLWEEGGYRDADGEPVGSPQEAAGVAVARLVHDGRPLAAVVHDPSLRGEPELLEELLGATRLTLVQNRSVEALRASERRNRALLDAIPDDMFRIRRDGTFLDFRSHAPDRLRLSAEDFIGANVRDAMPTDELSEQILEVIGRALDTGEAESTEAWLERGGGVRYIEARIVPSGEEEVLAIVRDITHRRRSEEQVERQRDFLSTVVNAASSIFCVVNPEGRVVRYNAACEELTGRPDDETARGRLLWELFAAPEDAEAIRLAFESGRSGAVFEHRWVTASGERLLIEWSSTPLVDEHGEERRLIHGVDVTERERQEAELRERYTFLSTVGRATPNLLAVVEADGRVGPDGVNAGFERALGWGDGETVGRPLAELVAPDDPSVPTAIAEAIVSGGVVEHESVWVARDGRRRISVAWSIRPLGELSGRRSYLVCGVDVTEQKRQHEELRASRSRIVEVQATERRRLERNLHDGAQQRLVSLSLALRLAQAKLDRDPEGASDILTGASAELALALEELRELARGIHPAVLTDRGLAAALEALAARAPLPVELDAVPAERLPGPVEAAAFYVVSEALANVAKYAHATVAHVSVACAEGQAVVEVSDDGVGGADGERGTGLRGLADRLEALDGRLAVESPVGRGTVVRATIPLPAAAEAEPVRIGGA